MNTLTIALFCGIVACALACSNSAPKNPAGPVTTPAARRRRAADSDVVIVLETELQYHENRNQEYQAIIGEQLEKFAVEHDIASFRLNNIHQTSLNQNGVFAAQLTLADAADRCHEEIAFVNAAIDTIPEVKDARVTCGGEEPIDISKFD